MNFCQVTKNRILPCRARTKNWRNFEVGIFAPFMSPVDSAFRNPRGAYIYVESFLGE